MSNMAVSLLEEEGAESGQGMEKKKVKKLLDMPEHILQAIVDLVDVYDK